MSLLVLDAGALIAAEHGQKKTLALIQEAQERSWPVVTSAAVVAQVWRDPQRQHSLGKLLKGVRQDGLATDAGKPLGTLVAQTGTSDVVDAHIASLCVDQSTLLTSDPDDLALLLEARQVVATVVLV
jgi:hypothetical protein